MSDVAERVKGIIIEHLGVEAAQVIDTATLKVGGKVVHLFGVEWVRGGQAEELARYIGNRPVTCQPAPGGSSPSAQRSPVSRATTLKGRGFSPSAAVLLASMMGSPRMIQAAANAGRRL